MKALAHRATTAHVQAAYPFVAEAGLGGRGVYIGQNLLGGAFVYDPFELYDQGVITSPNMLVAGQIGRGKSSLVKTYLLRQRVYGRRIVVLDPKGEYGPLARFCGYEPVRLAPGGGVRLNPLDKRIARDDRLRLLQTVAAAALERELSPFEEAALDRALAGAAAKPRRDPTLSAVVDCLLDPSDDAAAAISADKDALVEWGRPVAYELRRLVAGDLKGMFDGPTSGSIDLSAPFVSLDLSAVYDSDALGILMACAAAWLQGTLARDDATKTIFVVEEAWAALMTLATALWFQANFKLARARGLQNLVVIHRFSDLAAVGAQGSQQERVAKGLLSDTETAVVYAQSPAEVEPTKAMLGLPDAQAALLPMLERGVGLWRVAGRAFLVWHRLGRTERALVDTDFRMAA
ncbi:MAG: ATP-binding protein [Actinomycetota bacterium]|nr:ATP-binding protein [Actinomycetota bacterium]MDQ3954483.1 ATP-binding protein [Actinomycetota bacterium]